MDNIEKQKNKFIQNNLFNTSIAAKIDSDADKKSRDILKNLKKIDFSKSKNILFEKKEVTFEAQNNKDIKERFNQIMSFPDPLKEYNYCFYSEYDLNIIIDLKYEKDLEELGFFVASKDEFSFLKIDINEKYKGPFYEDEASETKWCYVFGLYWENFFDIDMRNHRYRYCYKINHLDENISGIFMQLSCPIELYLLNETNEYPLAFKESSKKIFQEILLSLKFKEEWVLRFSADPSWWSINTY